LHTPLNEKTKNIVSKEAFKKMKKGVRVVNCARGGLVDEVALKESYTELDAKIAVDYFERYFELDYYDDISQLLCKEILNLLGEYPNLSQFHIVNNANGIKYDLPEVYNINSTFSKNTGSMNHLNNQGNQIVFDKISHWLSSIN
jgi:hypothetical protein